MALPIFSWFSKPIDQNPTKQKKRTPNKIDFTDEMQCSHDLTRSLYHNSYPGLKLAGALAFNPIAIPVWFMSLPIAESDNEADQELLTQITDQFSSLMKQIHIECHRDGTVWIHPFYSTKDNRLHWEIIPDGSVINIVRDIQTKRIVQLDVDEELTIATKKGKNANVRRTRTFTAEKIIEVWTGDVVAAELKSKSYRNITGELPIPFANNADATEVRGHSDYERIIYDMKDYHDIDLMQSKTLAKFNIKMTQKVKDVKSYLANNGFSSIADVDIPAIDFIMNVDGEETDLLEPARSYEAYESALKRKFRKMVEGSGIPEICWGIKTQGNHASAEEQMGMLIQFVQDKREQLNNVYARLFTASIKLLGITGMRTDLGTITVTWGSLDELSAATKAEVFKNFAEGVSKLVESAGMTKAQLYRLWDNLYPEATKETLEEFIEGISFMAKHKQFKDELYLNALDMAGDE